MGLGQCLSGETHVLAVSVLNHHKISSSLLGQNELEKSVD